MMKVLVASLLGMTMALAAPAAAQISVPPLSDEQTAEANSAMTQLRSPYTPSHTVDMCPSSPALRDTIRVAAASGMSSDEIVEGVIARHGEQLRIVPKRSGAGLFAWIATPLLLLIGGGLIVARLRRDQAESAEHPAPPDALNDDERSRLTAALGRFDSDGGGSDP
jgi:cytochrome c-type biogenesis protein CcmH